MRGIERTSPTSARAVRAYPGEADGLLERTEAAANALSNWRFEDREGPKLHLVRESKLFRFKDDVTVIVSNGDVGCEAVFESASRIGKGDFGQNLRNLRNLTVAVDQRLGWRNFG